MPEHMLPFGDESPLAARLREALGASTYESIVAVTPQFDRDDGVKVTARPRSVDYLDKIKKLPHDVLMRIGVGAWEKTDTHIHYLFPAEWYDYIPEGYEIVTINGSVKKFVHGETPDERRFGMLAFGWIREE